MPTQFVLPCPICHNDLDISATVILDSEGPGDGIHDHSFLACEDYEIGWESHRLSDSEAKEYGTIPSHCESLYNYLNETVFSKSSTSGHKRFLSMILNCFESSITSKAVQTAEHDEKGVYP